jgi:hypothetical protein
MRFPSTAPRLPARSWGSTLLAASAVSIDRFALWPFALAGFLARGGIVVFLLPIVIMPTPSGVENVIAPAVTSFAFGLVSQEFVAIVIAIAVSLVTAIVLGGLAGAWVDVQLVRAVAPDRPADESRSRERRGMVLRAFGVRFLSHLPLWLALSWGAVRIVQATYAELVTPFEVVTPLAFRVLTAVPDAIAVVLGTWILGEAAGGLGVRRLILRDAGVARASVGGWLDLARHPMSSVATIVTTNVGVGVAVVPALLASTAAWSWLRTTILGGSGAVEAGASLALLVGVWLAGLLLASAATAWRSVVWTAEAARHDSPRAATGPVSELSGGTFGDAARRRPGDWSSSDSSGRL